MDDCAVLDDGSGDAAAFSCSSGASAAITDFFVTHNTASSGFNCKTVHMKLLRTNSVIS